jgi:hypothetical protein
LAVADLVGDRRLGGHTGELMLQPLSSDVTSGLLLSCRTLRRWSALIPRIVFSIA